MTRSAVTRLALLASLATVAVTGCSIPAERVGALAGALVPFDACDDALSYLKSEALERVGPYGLDGSGTLFYGRDTVDSAAGAEESAPVAGAAPGSPDTAPGFSGTNVQEAGVDEPDIVKTDGELIVSVVDGVLRVIDAATDAQVGRLELLPSSDPDAGVAYPEMMAGNAELLLAGDRAIVLLRQPMAMFDAPKALPGWSIYQSSRLISVDLSDPSEPTQLATLDLDGDIVSARLVDGVVRVAVRTDPALEFPYDEAIADDEDAMTARNREIVESSELVDWLPSSRFTSGDTEEENLLVPCDRLSYPEEFSGFSTVSVLSLPLDGDLRDPNGTGVLGSGDTVYASTDRFYVVTNGWVTAVDSGGVPAPILEEMTVAVMPPGGRFPAPVRPEEQRTGIHAFDISGSGPATYAGSGEVAGHLIGQYALSEWEGNLRVASTTGAMWGGAAKSESRVTVLAEEEDGLVEIGLVDGLGVGEQIFAVRYVGPTAYVVTFEQTDPLYVLDLADPTEPTVRGELKITGYSAYLHHVGEGRVVGVGQEARANGATVGAQVSLFDVSDPTAPSKLAGHVVRNGWTEAEYEARAFLYWSETRQLVIPMVDARRSGALVLTVGDDALTEVGWVTSSSSSASKDTGESVRRSLVIGDRLFTVWPDGIQSNRLDTLAETGWVPFD